MKILVYITLHLFAGPEERISKRLDYYMHKNDIPGVAVGYYFDGKPGYVMKGYADPMRKKPVTKDTIFEIGSCTKTFTATLLALEVDRGHMALDAPLSEYLPYLKNHPCALSRITLEQLATHTSGLPRNPRVPKRLVTKRRVLHSLLPWHPAYRPGTHYKYSNLGFNILGYALEKVTRTDYRDLVREAITEPLGMHNTMMHYRPLPSYAQGFSKRDIPQPPLRSPYAWAAGALRSTAEDMIQYLMANLGLKGPPEMIKAMKKAQRGRFRANKRMVQGLAWQNVTLKGYHIVDKNGADAGFSSWIGMIPDLNIAMVLLSNKNGGRLTALGRTLLLELAAEKHR